MSLSDSGNDKFKPIDLNALERFEDEHTVNVDKKRPGFDRFELLFEKPDLKKEESYLFEAMYDGKKNEEDIIFKSLIERNNEPLKKNDDKKELNDSKENDLLEEKEVQEPVETPGEKGYTQGYEKGLEQGLEHGRKKGYEDGFKKGEDLGYEKGEKLGIEKGMEQGLEQGLKEGEKKAAGEIAKKAIEILDSLEEILKTADQTLDLVVEKYEEKIISLIQQIAKKAVMAEIELNDEIVKPLILDALKSLVNPEEVAISVCQDDYEYIEMIQDEFFETIDSLSSVSLKSDASIKRGGCKIETITGSVETDPESRLEAIFEAIKKAGA